MRRLAWPVVVLLLAAAGGGYAAYTGQRIAALEAELDDRPAIGDLIVVGKEVTLTQRQACVRFRAFGSVEGNCSSYSFGGRWPPCYEQAVIGEALPRSCR